MKALRPGAGLLLLMLSSPSGAEPKTNTVLRVPLGLIEPDIPLDRPITIEKIRLGETLFFDTSLSRTGETSCATCHNPNHGFAEERRVSMSDGGTLQRRNAPTILNAGYLTTTMWDGRFSSLERQALDPFRADGDMGIDLGELIDRVVRDPQYVARVYRAFGGPPTTARLAEALASYQRSLVSGDTRFDRYLFGGEEDALSHEEKRGLGVFFVQGGCINCHDVFHPKVNPLGGGLALFTDFRFHNLGVGYANGRMRDTGRHWVTRDPEDWGAFRTPTLRNVALTAPYMHDGSLETLEDVVDFYDRGGEPNPNLSPSIAPLLLTAAEKTALVAFLRTLTDPRLVSEELDRQHEGTSSAQVEGRGHAGEP